MISVTEIEKFGPSHIRRSFGKLFVPYANKRLTKGYALQHYFYTTEHAVIFPPVSDNPESLDLESIRSVVKFAMPILFAMPDLFTKPWIFPVAQERILNKITRNNRDHWVVLHYNPLTGDSIVLDSSYKLLAQFYDNQFILQDLTSALEVINQVDLTQKLEIKKFDTLFLNAQNMLDYVSCGIWAAITADALAKGTPIETHTQKMSQLTKQEAADLLLEYKKLATSNDATHTTDIIDDLDNLAVVLPPVDDVFSQELKNSWHKKTMQHFSEIIHNPESILQALISRGSLSLSNVKITTKNSELLTQYSLDQVFIGLDDNYSGVRNCDINQMTIVKDPSGFSVDNRAINMFTQLGFCQQTINELKLSDMVKYESAIYHAIVCSGHEKFYELLALSMEESLTNSILKERAELTRNIYDSIKQLIIVDLSRPKLTLFKPAATENMESSTEETKGSSARCIIS